MVGNLVSPADQLLDGIRIGKDVIQRGGDGVESRCGGVGVGIGKGEVAGERRFDHLVERAGLILRNKGVVGVLFHQNARRVAEQLVGQLLHTDALRLEHVAPGKARRNIKLRAIVALGDIGERFARGDFAHGDGNALAADGPAGIVEALGDDVDPVVGRIAAQLAGSSDFQIDVAAALHRDRKGLDIRQSLVVGVVVVDIELELAGIGFDLLVKGVQLGDGFVVGIDLFVAVFVLGTARERA